VRRPPSRAGAPVRRAPCPRLPVIVLRDSARGGSFLMPNRKGFTLIDLLIVVVIIGILAAIAIPKFANTKQKAVKSSMISDLRNLATAQEAFYADSSKYATTYGTTIATGQGH